jgi:FKBP-type peptidyl-prolyl cis-trans isomerase FkpA
MKHLNLLNYPLKLMKMKRLTIYVLQLLFLSFAFVSCELEDSDFEKEVKNDDKAINDYLTQNNINAQKHSDGFYYEKLTVNDKGTSLVQDNVVDFYYKISLLNGTVLQEVNSSSAEPARFKLWSYAIVPIGLDDAIGMMKTGDKYRFYMPSYLAYGTYWCKEFDAFANFIIDVEVIAVHSEAEIETAQLDSIQDYVSAKNLVCQKTASGLFYSEIVAGNGSSPYSYSTVTIDFTRRYLNDTLIKSVTGIEIQLGDNKAVPGLEEGIKIMKYGGEALLIMPASIGFKQSLCIVPDKIRKELLEDNMISSEVKPYSIIKYNVKLKSQQ